MNDLQEQEMKLKQYMEQLENAEAARASLLSQLKHALQEQVQLFLLFTCMLILKRLKLRTAY